MGKTQKNDDWSKEIDSLESYFKSIKLPEAIYDFQKAETILNVHKFIQTHLETLKFNNGNKTYINHLDRLRYLKQTIITHK